MSSPGKQASRSGVAPDESELGRRIAPPGSCRRRRKGPEPERRRTGEPGGEELWIAGDELAIPLDIADNPAAEDTVRTVTTERNRQLGGLGPLAVRAPDRPAEVAERVPALDQDQQPGAVVTQADIGRTAGVRRSARELEACLDSRLAGPGGVTSSWIARCPASAGSSRASRRSSIRIGRSTARASRCQASSVWPPPRPRSIVPTVARPTPQPGPRIAPGSNPVGGGRS